MVTEPPATNTRSSSSLSTQWYAVPSAEGRRTPEASPVPVYLERKRRRKSLLLRTVSPTPGVILNPNRCPWNHVVCAKFMHNKHYLKNKLKEFGRTYLKHFLGALHQVLIPLDVGRGTYTKHFLGALHNRNVLRTIARLRTPCRRCSSLRARCRGPPPTWRPPCWPPRRPGPTSATPRPATRSSRRGSTRGTARWRCRRRPGRG